MRVTIKDLARECGVSVSTVSMALSDKPNRISEETRQKVRVAADRLHYQPNMAAVSLVRQKSSAIGVVTNDLRNTHIASLYMAINQEIEKNGISPICHVFQDGMDVEVLLNQMESENVSAVVWCKSLDIARRKENEEIVSRLDRMGIPIITMDQYHFENAGADVLFDYRKGALLAVRHLISNGHRHIGCLAGERDYEVTKQRLEGYREALKEAGITYDEALVCYGDYSLDSGYKALSYLLGQNVTAIFSFNDEMAFGLYRAARNYGIVIPNQLSVIGFDDVPFADVMEVPLTTIRVPSKEMGTFIGREIVKYLREGAEGRTCKIYEPTLMVRGSVAQASGR